MASLRKINRACAVDLNTYESTATPPVSLEFLCTARQIDIADQLTKNGEKLAHNLESTMCSYMDTVSGIDKNLTKVTNYDNWDKIDFRESGRHWEDIYEDEEFTQASIERLWLNGEYTAVFPYSSLLMHVHNLGYNTEDDAIDYEICIYDSNYVSALSESFHTPLLQARIALAIRDMDGKLMPAIYIYKASSFVNYNKFTKDYLKNDKTIRQSTKTFMYKVLSAIHMLEYSWALQEDDSEYTLMANLLAEFLGVVYTYNQQLQKAKSISRPVKTESNIIHEASTTDEATHANKVRYIGDSGISVTSREKPKTIPRDKIIHYSVSEWGRCAHYRHYKSGKVILVKSATVHRRCVDIDDKHQPAPTGTTYIVK